MAGQDNLGAQLTGSSTSSPSFRSADYVDAPSTPSTNFHKPVDHEKFPLDYFELSPASSPRRQPQQSPRQLDFAPSSNSFFSQSFPEPSNSTPLLHFHSESQHPLPSSHNPTTYSNDNSGPTTPTNKEHSSAFPLPSENMSFAPLPRAHHVNIDEIPLNSPLDDAPPEVESHSFKPSRGFIYAFLSICIITLAAALDATSLAIALPIITGKLHGTAIEAFWSGTSFLITSAVFQPILAGLSHIFGRKELILVSATFFAVGSFLGAIANNFTIMLIGRSVQGMSSLKIMLTDLVPLAYRGAWFGYLGSVWAIGSVTGPLMGASFAQRVTWRWIFWINLPIIGIGSVAILLFLKLDKTPGKISEKLARFDWYGSVVFCGSCVSFLIPLTWGGVMYSWGHWRTLVPLFVGPVGLAAFLYYEWLLSKKCWDQDGNMLPGINVEPIIRFTIFNNATMVLTYIQTVLHGIVLWSLLYFLPLYYEGVKEYSLILTGVAALPETGFVAPMAVMVGVISAKTGHYRWAIWVGWALTTFGAGLLVLLKPETTVVQWIFLNITISIGTGMLFTAMGLAVQAAGVPEDAGHAAGFYSFARVIGQSLGVAIGGVVFQNQIYSNLLDYPLLAPQAQQYSKEATVLVVIIKMMQPGPQKTQLIQAYSDALSMIWVVMCAVAGLGLLLSIFIKGYTLEQEHKTLQGYKYDGVDADEERASSSYGAQKYSSSPQNGHVYSGPMGSVSNLEMSNLSNVYGLSSAQAHASNASSLDHESEGMNRRRGATMSSSASVTGIEPQTHHTAL
ncbi:Putative MFS Transporter [Blumeria hordei DH14]|uniref:Putative MFS Transporter n=1 Tax=Blumeria graminis f. sp. hordei (strain DH14) TaxID=546991 RepID=N1JAU6_BLUG1|nr:Putative MFS Transporter [Blumeria hordei DH14]